MNTKKYCFLLISTVCLSQNKPLEADRPDQTETPAIVPKGMFQIESGFTLQQNIDHSKTNSLPSTLWKYGVNEIFELRLITELIFEKIDDKTFSGLNPILIGCKIKILEEKEIVPKTSFIGHIEFSKLASSRFKTNYIVHEFRFTMQHTLSDKITLGYNLGAEWDGFSKKPTFIYTLTSGYMISEIFGFYAEIFGFATQNEIASHNLDGGFTYLINTNFMVDLSSGYGITNNASIKYLALGFSIRF